MKIAYSYHGFNQKVGGVSRYFYEIIKRIPALHQVKIFTKYNNNVYLSAILPPHTFLIDKLNIKGHNRIHKLIEDIYLHYKLKTVHFDLLHHTGEEPNVFKWIQKPIVITIHDCIPELFYTTNKSRLEKRQRIIHKASAIICVSQNTKNDLLKFYPDIDENKVFVIYHGAPASINETEYCNPIGYPYILYVGSRYNEYKNFVFMLEALQPILIDYNIKLVCTGEPFNKFENRKIEDCNLHNHVLNIGIVSENELSNLYHFAECFIYPSKYEGFGIPILEAFVNQCPVCLSNTSCFPEIAGEAACYFDPDSKNSIQDCITNILNNPQLKDMLRDKGMERIKLFSWDKACKQTMEVYASILEQKRLLESNKVH